MKIVFHIPELSRSIPCLNNVRNYLNQTARSQEESIQVVFNADAVRSLVRGEESAERWLSLYEQYPCIQLLVCDNSLHGYALSPEQLIDTIRVIPAAVVALAELQQSGWIYIRP
ncbi:DsrE family protein [Salmonella enterica subsp. enterica serovar Bonariensis]|nr:DsrE family protein [Salmonella enterica subsp. enterica serovar Bonariensis]